MIISSIKLKMTYINLNRLNLNNEFYKFRIKLKNKF